MYTDEQGNRFYKVGLHTHTTLSDGHCTPEEAAKIYREAGYDAIAVTDHWKYYPESELEGLTILSGCEYNLGGSDTADGVMHIVGIGMKEDPCIDPKTATRQGVIDAIRASGGMAILAHPAWSLNTKEDAKALHGFSALEIYNSVSDAHQSTRPYSGYIVDALANDGYALPLIATDDTHYYDGSDETKSFTVVKAEGGSAAQILDGIRKGVFYASQGPKLDVCREGDTFKVKTSPCQMISFLSNAAWVKDRVLRGVELTEAEYTLKDIEKWVRIEVRDADGKYAWSNIYLR